MSDLFDLDSIEEGFMKTKKPSEMTAHEPTEKTKKLMTKLKGSVPEDTFGRGDETVNRRALMKLVNTLKNLIAHEMKTTREAHRIAVGISEIEDAIDVALKKIGADPVKKGGGRVSRSTRSSKKSAFLDGISEIKD